MRIFYFNLLKILHYKILQKKKFLKFTIHNRKNCLDFQNHNSNLKINGLNRSNI